MKIKTDNPQEFVKRAFWLLWNAIGGTTGMGCLQNNPDATEDDVFKNVCSSGDYACNTNKEGRFFGDYVFGRMMKWGCDITKDGDIDTSDFEFRNDYQGFSHLYTDNKSIFDATAKDLNVEFEVINHPEESA